MDLACKRISVLFGAFLLLAGALASSGCGALNWRPLQKSRVHHQQKSAIPVADVIGHVERPGAIEIPAAGLTLEQALARAGGVQETLRHRDPARVLVGVQSGYGTSMVVTWLPLSFIEGGPAGAVRVESGNLVRVLPAEATSLVRANDLSSSEPGYYSLRGMVAREGRYELAAAASGLPQVKQQALVSRRQAPHPSDVFLLTRKAPGALGLERFVIPLEAVSESVEHTAPATSSSPENDSQVSSLQTRQVTITPEALLYGSARFGLGTIPRGPTDIRPGDPRFGGQTTVDAQEAIRELQDRRTAATPSSDASPLSQTARDASAVQPPIIVLTSATAAERNPFGSQTRVRPGDDVLVTRLELVPLVLEGLVTPIAQRRAAEQAHRFRRQGHQIAGQPAPSSVPPASPGPVTRTMTTIVQDAGQTIRRVPLALP